MREIAFLLCLVPNAGKTNEPFVQQSPAPNRPVHPTAAQRPAVRSPRLTIRWLGQDGKDFVSPNNRHEPSDVQDIHLQLANLDPDREIDFIDLTGQGSDQWHYNAQSFSWKMQVERTPHSTSADLYIEPARYETGREFHLKLRYKDASTAESTFRGGAANPYLRMPAAAVSGLWVGQDGQDWSGLTPSVGPDGLQDIRIRLQGLSVKVPIRGIRLQLPNNRRWEFGPNPKGYNSAELHRDPANNARGDLFFQPDQDLRAQPVAITILYDNDKLDKTLVNGEPCNPRAPIVQAKLPRFEPVPALALQWMGQDSFDPDHPGHLHVRLNNLPPDRPLAAAMLSNSAGSFWSHRINPATPLPADPGAKPLLWRPICGQLSADLLFEPERDSGNDAFTLRLLFDDGVSCLVPFVGAPCDLAKKSPQPDSTRVIAHPGDNLQDLLDHHGAVRLAPGIHRLDKPLILNRPVTLSADPAATIRFYQPDSEPPWTTAIKIHHGNTTLENFKVRFDGPVRWNNQISYGPAVIGLTDPLDRGYDEIRVNIRLRNLDLEVPPVPPSPDWTEAIRLMRLVRASSGEVIGNTLRGGPIECFSGPWIFENNTYLGCLPNTFSHGVVTWHIPHDVVVRNNTTRAQGPSGKTWRFLVLTGQGSDVLVEKNRLEDLGARDDDTIPWSNEPEIILTESYRVKYEGIVAALALDGRILRITPPQSAPIRGGDIVSFLTGPTAGQWRIILQPIDATTFLVDKPIPAQTTNISISSGFVRQTYRDNTIDIRGGQKSDALVLAGNHFGTLVTRNHFMGGDKAIRAQACATESPISWGWSHAPFLGVTIKENLLEDAETGALIGVEHSQYTKSNRGRLYQSVLLHDNLVRWTPTFLADRRRQAKKDLPNAFTLGYLPSLDPNELWIDAERNRLQAPSLTRPVASLWIRAALYNSQPILDRHFSLSTAAAPQPPQAD